jgi:uncharacterized membrane protein (UPF0127 family)
MSSKTPRKSTATRLPALLRSSSSTTRVAAWGLGLGLTLIVGLVPSLTQAAEQTVSLTIKSFQVKAEVADRPATRARGLMHRESLPDNHGMLFVFDSPSRQCMWMKNTPLPLSVAFIKADGRIANIAQMQPQTETIHCSTENVLYALEMTQGWFWARAVKPGDAIGGLPHAPSRRQP